MWRLSKLPLKSSRRSQLSFQLCSGRLSPAATRHITSYLKDVLRTRSFSPTNPLIEAVWFEQSSSSPLLASTENDASNEGKESVSPISRVPDLSEIQPYHVTNAVKKVADEYISVQQQEQQQETTLQDLLQYLDRSESSVESVRQITSLLWLMSDASQKPKWKAALGQVNTLEGTDPKEFYDALKKCLKKDQISNGSLNWAAQDWLRNYEHRTGVHLNSESQAEFQKLSAALDDVEEHFQNAPASSSFISVQKKKHWMGDMYNYIGIRHRQAELLGYSSVVEQVLETRMANVEEIMKLHQQVTAKVVPILNVESPVKPTLSTYLSPAGPMKEPKQRSDKSIMIRLEEHVTLDGALFFLSHLVRDLLGVTMVEDSAKKMGWHPDVRLFHFMDEANTTNQNVGSFFLDPYRRTGKIDRPLTSPLISRSESRVPIVALSLSMEPPAWDTEAGPMSWEDVESLFHEMGHVFQVLLAQSTLGTLLGPQKMPFDLSELLPKFMEHWLTERSAIYTLIGASQGRGSFLDEAALDESIDAAFRVRAREKAWRLAQQAFYGSLELSLLSNFDIKGKESILGLQNRLAQELIPHDLPDEKDITPLLDIFRENSSGRPVSWYRYLWCDALSASIFDQVKQAYSTENARNISAMKQKITQVLLKPGACVQPRNVLEEFQLDGCSPDALFKRYNLK